MRPYRGILRVVVLTLALIMVFVSYVFRVAEWTKALDSDFIVYGAQSGGSVTATITYFPQIADGGGYSTTFTILNTTGSTVTGRLRLFDEDGSGKVLQINSVTDSQFSVSVPANGTARFTTPNSGNVIVTGWASFESTPRLQGVATFDYRSAGTLLATAGVLGTAGATRVIVPIDLNGGLGSTGIAIANVQSNSSIAIRLRLYSESGEEIANIFDSRLNPLRPQNHVADFIEHFFKNLAGNSFKGSLAVEVVGSGIAAVTGLNIKEGLLSTVPAIEVSSNSILTPDFTVSVSPSSLNVAQNSSATFTLTLTALNGFSGTVTLGANGLPPGTSGFLPSGSVLLSSANSPLRVTNTVTPNNSALLTSYSLIFAADSGAIHKEASANLIVGQSVVSAPTLNAITPSSGTAGTSVTVTLTGTNFTSDTTVSIGGSGVSVGSVQINGTTSLTANFIISTAATGGAHTVTVTNSGGTSNSVIFSVSVPTPTPTAASISPSSGTAGTSVTVTMTGTNFINGGTTVGISGTGISLGSPQVASPTSLSVALTIGSTASAGNRTVTVTTAGGTSNGVVFTVVAGSSKPFNQTQTERLIGTWTFTWTIISTFTETFRLNNVQASTVTPGDWNVFGADQYGTPVIAGYATVLGKFDLYDPGSIIDEFFVFDFTGTDTVAGCYYLINPPRSTNLSSCYPMSGRRISTSALSTALSNVGIGIDFKNARQAEVQQLEGSGQPADQNLIRALGILRRERDVSDSPPK